MLNENKDGFKLFNLAQNYVEERIVVLIQTLIHNL